MIDPSLEAVLFDAGGTLVRLDYEFMADACARRGLCVEVADLARGEARFRQTLDEVAGAGGDIRSDRSRVHWHFETLLCEAGLPAEHLEALVADCEAEHQRGILWRVPVDGVHETLEGLLEQGLRVAVVSNADGRLEALLEATGMTGYLEFAIDSHLEGVEKPDPEIFRRALARLGVEARRARYVGDIYSVDAVGARAAGIEPVILDATGIYRPKGCAVISDLRQLLEGGAARRRWEERP